VDTETEGTTFEATPRMLELANELWKELRKEAKGSPGVLGVFEGSMTAAYERTGASRTHYSKLYELLREMGCIVVERKGRRDVSSRVVLLEPPTQELYDRHRGIVEYRLTHGARDATMQLEQRVSNIEGRMSGIDFTKALVDFEQRLRKLENAEREET